MNYFMVQFGYDGPRSNFPESKKANDACWKAGDQAEALLRSIPGIKVAHAYSWPDGSCYKYACGDMSKDELYQEAHKRLTEFLYSVLVTEQDPEKDPFKCGCETLREYLAKDGDVVSTGSLDSI